MLAIFKTGPFRDMASDVVSVMEKLGCFETVIVTAEFETEVEVVASTEPLPPPLLERPWGALTRRILSHAPEGVTIDLAKDTHTAELLRQNGFSARWLVGVPVRMRDKTPVGAIWALGSSSNDLLSGFRDLFRSAAGSLAALAETECVRYRDAKSGAYTRAYLEVKFDCWMRQRRGSVAAFAVDAGAFEFYRDVEGSSVAEAILLEFVRRLSNRLGPGDVLARLGDSRFVILTDTPSDAVSLMTRGRELLAALAGPFTVEGRDYLLRPRVGISVYPQQAEGLDDLLRQATTALHWSAGPDQIALYRPVAEKVVGRQLDIATRIGLALRRAEFTLHYQPKFLVRSPDRMVAAEALIRWPQADGAWITPGEFIPIAESTGSIVELGRWVLKTACAQNYAWQAAGFPPMIVWVNVSAAQFEGDDMISTIEAALAETGLDPRWLGIEITESLLMRNSTKVANMLRSIGDLGVSVAIDDFGTGFSSLAYLRRFSPTHLKIDQSFVREMSTDPGYHAIVAATVHLGHNLGMAVVGEGVETADQLETLRTLGCDAVQGYLLSPPLPADELEQGFLAKNRCTCH